MQTTLANPLDKFELDIRKLIEELMIERMAENDEIVTRWAIRSSKARRACAIASGRYADLTVLPPRQGGESGASPWRSRHSAGV